MADVEEPPYTVAEWEFHVDVQHSGIAAQTLNDLFGAENEAGLKAGSSLEDASVIWIPGRDRTFARYYYQNSFLGKGWRSGSDSLGDAGNTPIPRKHTASPHHMWRPEIPPGSSGALSTPRRNAGINFMVWII